MNLDFKFYWKLFWRRLPVMAALVLACATLGVITAMKLPETWSTSARLLVEAPQIPSDMAASSIRIGTAEQLDIIQQRLLTRANMIDIANKFDVFRNLRSMSPDDVEQKMRSATQIRYSVGSNQATLLTIRFEARSGQIAAAVVNEYVTLVQEENADIRGGRVESTLAFFKQEVERLDEELSLQSARISSFKSENVDALPDDQNYRKGRQTLLQERLSRLERDLSSAIKQRDNITRIFESTGSIRPQDAPPLSRAEQQLAAAEEELSRALTVYSDSHPRLTQLKTRIARLEAEVAGELEVADDSDGAPDTGPSSAERAIFQTTLSEIESRIELLSTDIEDTKAELEELESAISRSASIGIELASLERDYANLQARYNIAVNNLNDARMSERIETTAQGQRITMIESANIPGEPSGPNRPKIAIAGLGFGGLLAVGYFALMEVLNRTVRRPAELTGRFNVVPLVVIPYMESRMERLLRRGGILLATGVVLVGVPLLLWYIDTNYLPLDLVVQRGLEQLGLG